MIAKKSLLLLFASSIVSAPLIFANPSYTLAQGAGQTVHLNGEGRRQCRALKAKGSGHWVAKVRGRYLDKTSFTDRFTVRYCFATKSKCKRFVARFKHIVQGVEQINHASCKKS